MLLVYQYTFQNGENFPFGEPIVPDLEHFFKSLIDLYHKLVELGFRYSKGKVSVVEHSEEFDDA